MSALLSVFRYAEPARGKTRRTEKLQKFTDLKSKRREFCFVKVLAEPGYKSTVNIFSKAKCDPLAALCKSFAKDWGRAAQAGEKTGVDTKKPHALVCRHSMWSRSLRRLQPMESQLSLRDSFKNMLPNCKSAAKQIIMWKMHVFYDFRKY